MSKRPSKKLKRILLKRAYALLKRPYGWTKHMMQKSEAKAPDGHAYCILGALMYESKAMLDESLFEGDPILALQTERSVKGLIERVLREEEGKRTSIPLYNDRASTRKKDVLGLFEKAIDKV